MNTDRQARQCGRSPKSCANGGPLTIEGIPRILCVRGRRLFLKCCLICLRTTPRAAKAGFVIEAAERCRT